MLCHKEQRQSQQEQKLERMLCIWLPMNALRITNELYMFVTCFGWKPSTSLKKCKVFRLGLTDFFKFSLTKQVQENHKNANQTNANSKT